MKMPRIFVSHSHHDSDFGLRLVESLRERLGDDAVWYDQSGGLHGGDEWWDKIVAEITARDTFLVILSPNALASKWVPKEMSIAYRLHVELGHRLLPLILLPAQQRADWAIIQSIDFTGYPATYTQKLNEVLDALKIDTTKPPTPTVVEARSPMAQRWAEEAFSAFGQENWSAVIDKTDLLIKSNEMTAALWRIRGLTLQIQGLQGIALQALDESLKLEPYDVATMRAKGRVLLAIRNYYAAIETLTEAQAIPASDDAETRLPLLSDLCEALVEAYRWDDVSRRADDALRLAPNDSTWLKRKLEASRMSKPEPDTLALARRMRASQPILVSEWLDEQYEQYISLERRQAQLLTYHRIDVINWINLALEADPNNHKWLKRKLEVTRQGWRLDTAAIVREVRASQPMLVSEWINEQYLLWEQDARRSHDSIRWIDLALDFVPDNPIWLRRKLDFVEQLRSWPEESGVADSPRSAALAPAWGLPPPNAPATVRDILARAPTVVEQWLEHLEHSQQWERAIRVYDVMLERHSNDARLFGRKVHAFEQWGRWDEQVARQIARSQPDLALQWAERYYASPRKPEYSRRPMSIDLPVINLALEIHPKDSVWLKRKLDILTSYDPRKRIEVVADRDNENSPWDPGDTRAYNAIYYEEQYCRDNSIQGWPDALAFAQNVVTWQPQPVWDWVSAQWPLIERERRKADALALVALALRIAPKDRLWLARGQQIQQWPQYESRR